VRAEKHPAKYSAWVAVCDAWRLFDINAFATSAALRFIDCHSSYYRATLCGNAVLAVGRRPSVCLSVRLSATLVYCIYVTKTSFSVT